MKLFAYPLLLLAGVGFLLSVMAHLMGLCGKVLPGGGLVWLLHIGIFVVWPPAILISNNQRRDPAHKAHWEPLIAGGPIWMRRAIKVLFAYAIVNFLLFMAGTFAHPKPKGPAPPSIVRGFSGHWMVFYGVAFVTFYSAVNAPRLRRTDNSPKKHSTPMDTASDL